MKRITLYLKTQFRKLLNQKGDPKHLAKSFAIGNFLGMMPLPGLQMLVAFALSPILKLNKTACVTGTLNTNPITAPFIFFFNYKLGVWLLDVHPVIQHHDQLDLALLIELSVAGGYILECLLAGGIVAGIINAIGAYYLSLAYFRRKMKRVEVQAKE